jgi:hypothetical protein
MPARRRPPMLGPMPMIDVYAVAGTFRDKHDLAATSRPR